MTEVVLVAGAAATWAMIGLIWFVQVVHYPLLGMVGADDAPAVGARHQSLTARVVGLPMATEGITALALLVRAPEGVSPALPWLGAVLLAVALGTTITLSVPLHRRMLDDPGPDVGRRLVATNWIRTAAWTARGGLLAVMVVQAVGGSG